RQQDRQNEHPRQRKICIRDQEGKLMKSRKRSHHFLHTPLFFNGLITINGYQSINRSRDWENIMSQSLSYDLSRVQ
ncbi:hypothetical protein, partial [Staphylococcus pseudintermedius]|uniref:hypothetical protein n=1 Tax=Staphylococcus pseudintermedius TaxID=283734 RepID=UPI001C6F5CC6